MAIKTGKESPNFVDRTGEIHYSNEGYKMEIIECFSKKNCTIKIYDCRKTILYNIQYGNIKNGGVSNPYHPSVQGMGYYGEGKYKAKIKGRFTPQYVKWAGIIERVYSESKNKELPTYKHCTIDNDWLNFQNFAEWFDKNWNPYMIGWHLDKDILQKGNKHYSPETCRLVPPIINTLFINRVNDRGLYPIGVIKAGKKYKAQISEGNGKQHKSRPMRTPEEAFNYYKIYKENYIKKIADLWKDWISLDIFEAMYNWKIEITD